MGDPQVVRERPAHEGLPGYPAQRGRQQPRGNPGNDALDAQEPGVVPEVVVRERRVALERVAPGRPSVNDPAKLATTGDAEVERGADPLGGERQAVPRRVTHE